LRGEFPELVHEEAPGYAMRYSRHRAVLLPWLLLQFPFFLLSMRRDGRMAVRLARKHGAGMVIADGRYGFRAPGVRSVFVTHQLEILPPGPAWFRSLARPVLRLLNRRALRRFDSVWVPDFPGPANLSGALGHPAAPVASVARHVEYIRPLCRFRPVELPWNSPQTQDAAPAVETLARSEE